MIDGHSFVICWPHLSSSAFRSLPDSSLLLGFCSNLSLPSHPFLLYSIFTHLFPTLFPTPFPPIVIMVSTPRCALLRIPVPLSNVDTSRRYRDVQFFCLRTKCCFQSYPIIFTFVPFNRIDSFNNGTNNGKRTWNRIENWIVCNHTCRRVYFNPLVIYDY